MCVCVFVSIVLADFCFFVCFVVAGDLVFFSLVLLLLLLLLVCLVLVINVFVGLPGARGGNRKINEVWLGRKEEETKNKKRGGENKHGNERKRK